MPSKHINFSQSLLGFGSYILSILSRPLTIDQIWDYYQKDLKQKRFNGVHDFDNLILTLIFLFNISAINNINGIIFKCN